MLVTNKLHALPNGGRERLRKLNYDVLKHIYGDQLVLVELFPQRVRNLNQVVNAFRGYIDGLTDEVVSQALKSIKSQPLGAIFIDGSNLGEFAKVIKRNHPNIQIITFFHNVEAVFFAGALRYSKTPRALAVLVSNYLSERKAVHYSDKIICLSERDSHLLHKIYGRGATHISAIALQDAYGIKNTHLSVKQEPYALFVGGSFYANRAGITWFVENVVPRIHFNTIIVGRGFEDLKAKLEQNGKVLVVGTVDDLSEWYLNACFVIAPIFGGSGMKTKVAEALMYGKRIIGTPEAFSGYEGIADRVGWICTTAADFVNAIEQANSSIAGSFDPALRVLYEEHYSFAAKKRRLSQILGQHAFGLGTSTTLQS